MDIIEPKEILVSTNKGTFKVNGCKDCPNGSLVSIKDASSGRTKKYMVFECIILPDDSNIYQGKKTWRPSMLCYEQNTHPVGCRLFRETMQWRRKERVTV